MARSTGASSRDVDADARSQFGIRGGTASAAGAGRPANFGATVGSGAHTGFGGRAGSGLGARVADVGFFAGRLTAGVGRGESVCGASGLGVRVADVGFFTGRRAAAAGLAPSISRACGLSPLWLLRAGSEALSSLSGVLVSAVGMPQYGVRHTRWKVPWPIPLEGVRRREFGGPARGC